MVFNDSMRAFQALGTGLNPVGRSNSYSKEKHRIMFIWVMLIVIGVLVLATGFSLGMELTKESIILQLIVMIITVSIVYLMIYKVIPFLHASLV